MKCGNGGKSWILKDCDFFFLFPKINADFKGQRFDGIETIISKCGGSEGEYCDGDLYLNNYLFNKIV